MLYLSIGIIIGNKRFKGITYMDTIQDLDVNIVIEIIIYSYTTFLQPVIITLIQINLLQFIVKI